MTRHHQPVGPRPVLVAGLSAAALAAAVCVPAAASASPARDAAATSLRPARDTVATSAPAARDTGAVPSSPVHLATARASGALQGRLAHVAVRGGVAHVSGWAAASGTDRTVHVAFTLGRHHAGRTVADRKAGPHGRHGFTAAITVPEGRHRLCALAVAAGHQRRLGCRTVHAHYRTPGVPTHLQATRTSTTITLHWRAPQNHGGGVLHAYRITASAKGSHKKVTAPPDANHVTITGLAPTHRYAITVRARNAEHAGEAATLAVTTTYPRIPAQRTPPITANSHYLRHLTGDPKTDHALMYRMGVRDAKGNHTRHRYLVLQDIGGQFDGGVLLSATINFVPYDDLVEDLRHYLDGYASAQRYNAPVVVALGTNNDGLVNRAEGRIWAQQVVNPLARYASHHFKQISVAGADDIEPGFVGNVTVTKAWVRGYLASTRTDYVFNGAPVGCPSAPGYGRVCNHGWTLADFRWFAGGGFPGRTINLPQIYNHVMPWQWHLISAVGDTRLQFAGPLTQVVACRQAAVCTSMKPEKAWQSLWDALNSDPRTTIHDMPYITDLRID